jgi:LysR family transcriptional regulator for metE and metH
MSDLTLKDLQLIEAIAESGTLTGAARRLHITQSAVSQRLSNLQARVNMTLVERHDGVMGLTPAGERVLAAAQLVGSELRSTLHDLSSLTSQRDQHFQVATQCYTCYRWLPYVISAMRDAYPLLNVDVVPEATDSPYAAVEKQQIDVAIVSNPDPDSTLAEVELFNDELFAVMHESHPLAKRSYLPAASFSGQTLVLYTGKKHAIVEEVLRPAGVTDYSLVQVRITEAIIELARAGQGVAIIAGWALDDIPNAEDLVAVRITRSGFVRTWRAVFDDTGDAAHRDMFIKNVKRVGAKIGSRQWRKKLQRRVA